MVQRIIKNNFFFLTFINFIFLLVNVLRLEKPNSTTMALRTVRILETFVKLIRSCVIYFIPGDIQFLTPNVERTTTMKPEFIRPKTSKNIQKRKFIVF